MDAFSYLSVLLSIILGLAITQILQGYRALLLARGRVRLYAPALIWSALLLLFSTQAWWASFGLRDYRQWNFIIFAVILLQMVLIYMMTAALLPDVTGDREIDLERHYNEQRRHFFGFLIATVGVSIFKDVLLDGRLPETTNPAGPTGAGCHCPACRDSRPTSDAADLGGDHRDGLLRVHHVPVCALVAAAELRTAPR